MAQRVPYWPFVLVPLVVGGLALAWWKWPAAALPAANNAARSPIPDLGSRGKSLPVPTNQPAPDDPDAPAANDVRNPDGTEPEPEPANSAREIEIFLGQLAHATNVRDSRGIKLAHESLAKCRPSTLVDECLRKALESEASAWVRIEYFRAFHATESRRDWAFFSYDRRTGKFMGTDSELLIGEPEELKLLARTLMEVLAATARDGIFDERLMSLLRNLLDTEKPEWLLREALWTLVELEVDNLPGIVLPRLRNELRALLERATAPAEIREAVFVAWLQSLPDINSALADLESPKLQPYLCFTVSAWDLRAIGPEGPGPHALRLGSGTKYAVVEWLVTQDEPLRDLYRGLLHGNAAQALKQQLIQALAKYEFPHGRELVDAGLTRKDGNCGDYLAALGAMAKTADDLRVLTAAAAEPEVAFAQGAVEGLRQSYLREADGELRSIVEQGTNVAIQSQALGALLGRARTDSDRNLLLEEYLNPNKEAGLRAVAVAHVSDVERLKRLVDEDESLRVRQAALTKLGDLKDKKLRPFFLLVKDRDASPVLRQQARKYAEELRD